MYVMRERAQIKEAAKERLARVRGQSIGVYVVYTVLVYALTGMTLGIGALLVMPPLLIGLTYFFMGVWRGNNPPFETLFSGFYRYLQSLVAILWRYLFTFLWSLLLVIPGIIKSMAYSMTPYLVADYPDLDARRALKISMAITDGHKMEIFVMYLSFAGWMVLSMFTLEILHLVYVGPYMETAMAGLYDELLADALDRRVITEADLRG